jgi:hypothetical protein
MSLRHHLKIDGASMAQKFAPPSSVRLKEKSMAH